MIKFQLSRQNNLCENVPVLRETVGKLKKFIMELRLKNNALERTPNADTFITTSIEKRATNTTTQGLDILHSLVNLPTQTVRNNFENVLDTQEALWLKLANMIRNEEPQKVAELLDEKVVKALKDIINTDSSKLKGPTKKQIALRGKIMKGEPVSDAKKRTALQMTPFELTEINKSYAIGTLAMMQKFFGNETAKLTGTTVPLNELPGATIIAKQLISNENPMIRKSAIRALSYIGKPEYKQDLTKLFTIAKEDSDKGVQKAAEKALAKLEFINLYNLLFK